MFSFNPTIRLNLQKSRHELLNSWILLGLIVSALIVHTALVQSHIMTRQTYHQFYQNQMEAYRIDTLYDIAKGYKTITYPLVTLLFLVQQTVLALFLQLPLIFMFKEIRFSTLFRILLYAYIPLLLLAFVHFLALWSLPAHELTAHNLKDIPLSLTKLVSPDDFPEHIYGFLGNINLFQAAWILIVTRGIHKTGKISFLDSTILVTGVWITLTGLQFLIINYLHRVFGG